jgi:hypothetical protein
MTFGLGESLDARNRRASDVERRVVLDENRVGLPVDNPECASGVQPCRTSS